MFVCVVQFFDRRRMGGKKVLLINQRMWRRSDPCVDVLLLWTDVDWRRRRKERLRILQKARQPWQKILSLGIVQSNISSESPDIFTSPRIHHRSKVGYRGDRLIVLQCWIRKIERICNLWEIERLSEQFYKLTAHLVLSKFWDKMRFEWLSMSRLTNLPCNSMKVLKYTGNH